MNPPLLVQPLHFFIRFLWVKRPKRHDTWYAGKEPPVSSQYVNLNCPQSKLSAFLVWIAVTLRFFLSAATTLMPTLVSLRYAVVWVIAKFLVVLAAPLGHVPWHVHVHSRLCKVRHSGKQFLPGQLHQAPQAPQTILLVPTLAQTICLSCKARSV